MQRRIAGALIGAIILLGGCALRNERPCSGTPVPVNLHGVHPKEVVQNG